MKRPLSYRGQLHSTIIAVPTYTQLVQQTSELLRGNNAMHT